METNWAAEHLQTIRTLMERSAIYRRALAPISTFVGATGILATLASWQFKIESARSFAAFWMTVSLVALVGAFLLARRQALKDREVFWSPPTRRVAQAMLPALFVGFFTGVLVFLADPEGKAKAGSVSLVWCILYGCALHSAGFFMPRGIKLLGWMFILIGCGFILALMFTNQDLALDPLFDSRGLFMGFTFGGLHLAYGIYLYLSKQRKNET